RQRRDRQLVVAGEPCEQQAEHQQRRRDRAPDERLADAAADRRGLRGPVAHGTAAGGAPEPRPCASPEPPPGLCGASPEPRLPSPPGFTGSSWPPGRNWFWPSIPTCSPPSRPLSITATSPVISATVTGFICAVLSGPIA